jgi:hypothetical protein
MRIKIPQWLRPDMRDIFFFAGLFGIGFGLWGYDPRLTFIVVGVILFTIAVVGGLPKRK